MALTVLPVVDPIQFNPFNSKHRPTCAKLAGQPNRCLRLPSSQLVRKHEVPHCTLTHRRLLCGRTRLILGILLQSCLSRDCHSLLAKEAVDALFESHEAILASSFLIPSPEDPDIVAQLEISEAWHKDFLPPGEEVVEPMSDLLCPIIADAHESANLFQNGDCNPAEHEVGGFLALSICWRDLIRNLLPQGSDGIVVVFENPCNPTFTHQVSVCVMLSLRCFVFACSNVKTSAINLCLCIIRSMALRQSSWVVEISMTQSVTRAPWARTFSIFTSSPSKIAAIQECQSVKLLALSK